VENANVQQIGNDEMTSNRLGIVLNFNFHCNARITRIRVRLLPDENRKDFPYIQIWRPSSQYSTTYTKIAQVRVTERHITKLKYIEADIHLTGIKRMLVESGDVIGYYHPPDSSYKVRSSKTAVYVVYVLDNVDGSTATSVDLKNKIYQSSRRHPLMEFTYGK